MWISEYRSSKLSSTKQDRHLFERAIPVKDVTGGWLTGYAIGKTGNVVLFDTKQKYQLVLDIVDIFGIRGHNRIYIPGIGFSDAGLYLKEQEYKNVLVGDVGEKSLDYQINFLGKDHVIKSDILSETISPLSDVVIDSSVLDVFLAKPGLPIDRAVDGMKRQMTTKGIFVCFSMNNQTIFRKLKGKFHNIWYAFIRMQSPQSSTHRKNNITSRSDVSLWICTDHDEIDLSSVKREYMSAFIHNPKLKDIRNESLSEDKFHNMTNISV